MAHIFSFLWVRRHLRRKHLKWLSTLATHSQKEITMETRKYNFQEMHSWHSKLYIRRKSATSLWPVNRGRVSIKKCTCVSLNSIQRNAGAFLNRNSTIQLCSTGFLCPWFYRSRCLKIYILVWETQSKIRRKSGDLHEIRRFYLLIRRSGGGVQNQESPDEIRRVGTSARGSNPKFHKIRRLAFWG